MKSKHLLSISIILFVTLLVSCQKETTKFEINEPITLVVPDTNLVFKKPGEKQNFTINYITDRKINYIQTLYEVDSFDTLNHVYLYPDTLFYENRDSAGKEATNKFIYTGSYTVPDTLRAGTRIKFKTSFKAEIHYYEKEFSIKVVQ